MTPTHGKTPRRRIAVKRTATKAAGRIVEAPKRTIDISGRKAIVKTVRANGERVTFEIPVGSLQLPESSAARAASGTAS